MPRPIVLRLRNPSSTMARVDGLEWSAAIAFASHDTCFGVRVNDPKVLTRLPEHLPPGCRPSASPLVDHLYSLWTGSHVPCGDAPLDKDVSHRLYAGAECIQETHHLNQILKTLEDRLRFDTALGARHRLFVHAGVVGWRGQAIAIPGRSFSGKTSLVAALVRAGAVYYSDEFAVLDDRGWVHPYATPLSIRCRDGRTARRCSVEALGGAAATGPLPVGLVAAMPYRPGACWRPGLLSPGQIVMVLLDNTVLARYRPDMALSILGGVANQAKGLAGERGEAEEAAALLLECLSRGTRDMVGEVGAAAERTGSQSLYDRRRHAGRRGDDETASATGEATGS